MAAKSTIYKARLNVADMDRHIYQDFNLTVACHPSETEARMMLRLLAYALHAGEGEELAFGRGISTDDEPDLWRKSLSNDIELWIDLGTPDEALIKKACGRSNEVVLYCYGDRAVPIWWDKSKNQLQRFDNLRVRQIPTTQLEELALMVGSSMDLQCSITDGSILFSGGADNLSVGIELINLQ
jgi:uncharacterized protein YaeQ